MQDSIVEAEQPFDMSTSVWLRHYNNGCHLSGRANIQSKVQWPQSHISALNARNTRGKQRPHHNLCATRHDGEELSREYV